MAYIKARPNGGFLITVSCGRDTQDHKISKSVTFRPDRLAHRLRMVQRYIDGEGSVTDLCARYGIPAHVTLQNWISLYNANRELRDNVLYV